ncbi:GlxA family transcriptional regulator [Tianweitania populi]|uniref:AraC family transcriptional regulator n=1 Tax=Tianweitania populi TaxID=1607949 RepID=A0A8J3DLU1_9HYPH|nr:AraC family transcriptional regulator [Tianweitania populi]
MKHARLSIFQPETTPLRLTFLVVPGASILCVASAIDPLRAANRIAGERLFDFRLVSADGLPALTSCGLPIAVEGAFDAAAATDTLIVIGGFGARSETARPVLAGIRKIARTARAIGGVEAGTWVLGHAGLLEGRAATTHWEDLEDFAAAFPHTDIRPDRYVIDEPIFTAGGASPTFDLMLHLVRSRLGMAVALDVASVFIYDQTRAASDAQPLVSLGRLDGYDPRLAKAIRLMESHIEHPLTTAAIARRTGISTRTLETLFQRRIGETPGAYALRLRLNAARRLVLDTSEPMAGIATRTGFASAASFSRAFAAAFGQPPTRMRRA